MRRAGFAPTSPPQLISFWEGGKLTTVLTALFVELMAIMEHKNTSGDISGNLQVCREPSYPQTKILSKIKDSK